MEEGKIKNNSTNFISNSLETLLLAGIIVLIVIAAKTENKPDTSILNRLFAPTQSERFFEAGREDFKQEIEIFTYSERSWRDDLLQIDPKLRDRL